MGAKTKTFKKRFIRLLIIIAVIAAVISGFNLYGAIQHANMVKFTVDKSVFKPGVNLPLKKGRDYRFIVADLSIKNNSLKTINIDPASQVYLTDKKGTRYGSSDLQTDEPLKKGALAGNGTMKGQVSFIVGNQTEGGFTMHLSLKNEELELSAGASPSL